MPPSAMTRDKVSNEALFILRSLQENARTGRSNKLADVKVVHDGRSALEAMKTFQPAVVLLDLGMPEMDGLEVARRMREDPQSASATLVAVTGWGQREDRRRTHEAGFDYHLVKPADMSTLQSILSPREAEEARNVVKH